MKWPWKSNLENRADSSYTDALIRLITQRANGESTAFPAAVGALEAASGLVSRAFATAVVESPSSAVLNALTPSCLALIGRALIRRGEIVFYIDTHAGMIDLLPCQSHDINGGPQPASWTYRCTVGGPERTFTYEEVQATNVVHLMYARDADRPWRGIGPLQSGQLTGKLAAEVLSALGDESSTPRGQLLSLPIDGDDPTLLKLKADIKKLNGQVAYLESGDYGGTAGGGMVNSKPERLGASPPAALVELFKVSREDVMAACGINPALLTDAQGTAMREAWRQFLFGTASPLGRLVATELTEKLGSPVMLDWAEMRASDIAGRARAFGVMVQNGVPMDQAAESVGLQLDDLPDAPPRPTEG